MGSGTGIRVQLAVSDASACPISAASTDVEIESLTVGRRQDDAVVGELTVANGGSEAVESPLGEPVFADGSRAVYRYSHDGGCPCQRVPDHGCPIRDLEAVGGQLRLSFIAPDLETVRAVVTDLRSSCGEVHVRRLTRSGLGGENGSLALVDRDAFTDRQYEVLETAHEMGYFESPKEATSRDVAAALDISSATFVEHLAVAQSKLLDQLLET
ncbi:helix-turn-helix domain-containing protein [Natrononativus amylolyticus]|uniref:helix-turn-helix domain-containing protein n=1 Tax=Natrononativus amylolyticus TaxID=2963434 RepID=UPI0020CD1EBA|nr:helix-turn-helix domain-containing protein [Natrononativus amylolyticus]